MKRRTFFGGLLGGLLGGSSAAFLGQAGAAEHAHDSGSDPDPSDVHPYFLQSGDAPPAARADIEELVAWQSRSLAGASGPRPRSTHLLTPTYRLLKWRGDIGAPGDFEGPVSLSPKLPVAPGYQLNAQILGMHVGSGWSGRRSRGTLSIEFRTRLDREPMTWLFAQQFDVADNRRTTVGLAFVGQRDGQSDPIVADSPLVDLRIQLIRHRGRVGVLRKVLQLAAYVVGLPVAGLTGASATLAAALPIVRAPRLLREAVAFSQAMFGGLSKEAPIWRSGFTSFAIAPGAGRLTLTPGLWIAIDDTDGLNLDGVQVSELGSGLALTKDGTPIDANHLILDLTLDVAQLTGNGRVLRDTPASGPNPLPDAVRPREQEHTTS
ncbi:MAG: hypothetical protein AAFU65_03625 [Pseudomonadota bacterium]